MKINISIIVGTRPQIIKIQPLIEELKKEGFKAQIVNTGQHYDYELSKKFFKELHMPNPSVNLGVGKGTRLEQISKIILRIENYFKKKRPDLVIVPGDTTSAVAAALATTKCGIKLAHLEAGARSNQFFMSEERNRRIIDHCSDLLLAPTKNCLKNLKNESVFGRAYFVGDTMFDLFLRNKEKYNLNGTKNERTKILVTIHRAENIDHEKNLKKICSIINKLAKNYELVFPIHPHTRKKIKEYGLKIDVKLIEPVGYLDLMKKLGNSSMVITDSGGLQKEAYWMGKPCITLRESTEWIETIEENANFLFPLSKPFPFNKIEKILKLKFKPKNSLYGNGNASKRIVRILMS